MTLTVLIMILFVQKPENVVEAPPTAIAVFESPAACQAAAAAIRNAVAAVDVGVSRRASNQYRYVCASGAVAIKERSSK